MARVLAAGPLRRDDRNRWHRRALRPRPRRGVRPDLRKFMGSACVHPTPHGQCLSDDPHAPCFNAIAPVLAVTVGVTRDPPAAGGRGRDTLFFGTRGTCGAAHACRLGRRRGRGSRRSRSRSRRRPMPRRCAGSWRRHGRRGARASGTSTARPAAASSRDRRRRRRRRVAGRRRSHPFRLGFDAPARGRYGRRGRFTGSIWPAVPGAVVEIRARGAGSSAAGRGASGGFVSAASRGARSARASQASSRSRTRRRRRLWSKRLVGSGIVGVHRRGS